VLGAAAVAAALVVSALLAALAVDVLRTERELERADLRYAAAPGDTGLWSPDALLPAAVARTVLGTGDDVAYRLATRQFRLSRPGSPIVVQNDVTRRSQAESELAHAAGADRSAGRRAQLANMRGILALAEARADQGGQLDVLLRRAVAQFRLAVALDGRRDDAKFNLEVALRLLDRSGSGDAAGSGGQRARTSASGAGAASAGTGF
jgi:hypothetical protein